MAKNYTNVSTKVIEDNLKYKGEVLITYKIEYPEFDGEYYLMSLKVINKFYKGKALQYKEYIEKELLPIAIEQYENSIENDFPFRTFEALQVFKITYNRACILSLYIDRYEYTGGAHGSTVRSSDTWNLQRAGQIDLEELYVCSGNYTDYLFREIKRQIEENPSIYFEDYEKLMVDTFNKNSFYCTREGVIIYYQQYDIAPYASGIREFLINYSRCISDPVKKCFAVRR